MLGAARWASAGTAAGGESFDFLLLDANARAVGLGGAYTALAADSNALLYNPAGLGAARAHEATFMHNQYVQGLTQEYVGFAAKQGWGLNLNYLSLSDIPRTTLSKPGGTGADFGLNDLAFGAGYGRRLGPVYLGVGGKYLREIIDNVAASGWAADIGLLAPVEAVPGLTFGAAYLNTGPNVAFLRTKERLPSLARGGAAYRFRALDAVNLVSIDVAQARTDKPRLAVGAETLVRGAVALRVGWSGRQEADTGIVGGVGWLHKSVAFDYAFAPLGDLGFSHRVSMTARWGGEPGDPEVEAASVGGRAAASDSGPSVKERFTRADRYIAGGSYDEARRELEKIPGMIAADDGRRIRLQERLGAIALSQGDVEGAAGAYTEGLELATSLGVVETSVADSYAGLARCMAARNRVPEAVKYYKKALELGPSRNIRIMAEEELKDLKVR